MPIDQITFSADETVMRFRQPFTTEGLNKKLAVATPPGIYRGFRLGADQTALLDRVAEIRADPDSSDHVAVYQTATGFSLTIRRTGGAFSVDLSAYTSQRVFVTIFASYALGATTSAVLRTYTVTEFDAAAEKDELIVLGAVDVPAASSPVAAGAVDGEARTEPWFERAPGIRFEQILANGNFSMGEAGVSGRDSTLRGAYIIPHWFYRKAQNGAFTDVAEFRVTAADAKFAFKSLEFNLILADSFTGTSPFIEQRLFVEYPFALSDFDGTGEPLQGIRGEFWLKRVQAADAGSLSPGLQAKSDTSDFSGSGTGVNIEFVDGVRQAAGTSSVSLAATDGDWIKVEFFVAPTTFSATSTILRGLSFNVDSGDYTSGAVGAAFRIDGVKLWVPTASADPVRSHGVGIDAGARVLYPQDVSGSGEGEALVESRDLNIARTIIERRLDALDDATNFLTRRIHGALDIGRGVKDGSAAGRNAALLNLFQDPNGASELVWESAPGTNGRRQRMYFKDGTVYWSDNAKFDAVAVTWSQDDATEPSFLLVNGGSFISNPDGGFFAKAAGSSPWTDLGWVSLDTTQVSFTTADTVLGFSNVRTHHNGIMRIVGAVAGTGLGDSNILASGTPEGNTLYAKSLPKAWGQVASDGGGGIGVEAGFNYSASIVGSDLRITFNRALVNASEEAAVSYCVVALLTDSDENNTVQLLSQTNSSFDIQSKDVSTGSLEDFSTTALAISFVVFGEQ